MIPKILQGPQSISELQGRVTSFNCSASGIPPPTILWTFTNNDNEVTAFSSTRNNKASENVMSEVDLFDVTEDNFGTYSCIALNIFDTVAEVATLVVKSSKFTIIIVMIALAYIYTLFFIFAKLLLSKSHTILQYVLCLML